MAFDSSIVVSIPIVDRTFRGLLYHLGTGGGKQAWQNPFSTGAVDVAASSIRQGQLKQVVDHAYTDQVFFTFPSFGSWVTIRLKAHSVRPTAYSMAHRIRMTRYYMRNWLFEGSVDGVHWATLRVHSNDTLLGPWQERAAWDVYDCNTFYSFFRIKMSPGGNDQGTQALVISCFELFGDMRALQTAIPRPLEAKSQGSAITVSTTPVRKTALTGPPMPSQSSAAVTAKPDAVPKPSANSSGPHPLPPTKDVKDAQPSVATPHPTPDKPPQPPSPSDVLIPPANPVAVPSDAEAHGHSTASKTSNMPNAEVPQGPPIVRLPVAPITVPEKDEDFVVLCGNDFPPPSYSPEATPPAPLQPFPVQMRRSPSPLDLCHDRAQPSSTPMAMEYSTSSTTPHSTPFIVTEIPSLPPQHSPVHASSLPAWNDPPSQPLPPYRSPSPPASPASSSASAPPSPGHKSPPLPAFQVNKSPPMQMPAPMQLDPLDSTCLPIPVHSAEEQSHDSAGNDISARDVATHVSAPPEELPTWPADRNGNSTSGSTDAVFLANAFPAGPRVGTEPAAAFVRNVIAGLTTAQPEADDMDTDSVSSDDYCPAMPSSTGNLLQTTVQHEPQRSPNVDSFAAEEASPVNPSVELLSPATSQSVDVLSESSAIEPLAPQSSISPRPQHTAAPSTTSADNQRPMVEQLATGSKPRKIILAPNWFVYGKQRQLKYERAHRSLIQGVICCQQQYAAVIYLWDPDKTPPPPPPPPPPPLPQFTSLSPQRCIPPLAEEHSQGPEISQQVRVQATPPATMIANEVAPREPHATASVARSDSSPFRDSSSSSSPQRDATPTQRPRSVTRTPPGSYHESPPPSPAASRAVGSGSSLSGVRQQGRARASPLCRQQQRREHSPHRRSPYHSRHHHSSQGRTRSRSRSRSGSPSARRAHARRQKPSRRHQSASSSSSAAAASHEWESRRKRRRRHNSPSCSPSSESQQPRRSNTRQHTQSHNEYTGGFSNGRPPAASPMHRQNGPRGSCVSPASGIATRRGEGPPVQIANGSVQYDQSAIHKAAEPKRRIRPDQPDANGNHPQRESLLPPWTAWPWIPDYIAVSEYDDPREPDTDRLLHLCHDAEVADFARLVDQAHQEGSDFLGWPVVQLIISSMKRLLAKDRTVALFLAMVDVLFTMAVNARHGLRHSPFTEPEAEALCSALFQNTIVTQALVADAKLQFYFQFGSWLCMRFPDTESTSPGNLHPEVKMFLHRLEDEMHKMRSNSKKRLVEEKSIRRAQEGMQRLLMSCGQSFKDGGAQQGYFGGESQQTPSLLEHVKWIKRNTRMTLGQATDHVRHLLRSSGDVEVTNMTFALMCPISRCRITYPGKGIGCAHVDCFDLLNFLTLNFTNSQLSTKDWSCPVCDKLLRQSDLIYDPYYANILQQSCRDTEHVVVQPTGQWDEIKRKGPVCRDAISVDED